MCKVTKLDTTPLCVPSFRKAALPTPTATPIQKRVSFHDTVDVYVIDRLDAFAVRELFYRSEDYRRFRSESCLDILQANASNEDPLKALFRSLFGGMGSNRRQNWIQQHHQQQRQYQAQCRRCTTQAHRASPERLLRELAFV